MPYSRAPEFHGRMPQNRPFALSDIEAAASYYIKHPIRPYIGLRLDGSGFDYFESATEPTREDCGLRWAAVVGPFRTKRAARWAAQYGHNNPHFQYVEDAERLSRP